VAASEVPDYVVDYLDEQKTLTLATATADGGPHAVTLVYVNKGPVLYVWLRQSTVTNDHIQANSAVAFAIDQYADDWRQTKGVQGTGSCEAVTQGEEIAEAADLFGQKFPDLRPGATSVVTFFRITPNEVHFIDNTRGEGDPEPDEYRRESFGGG
jgi:uncharacterized protein YhbP (UPF0306 family)